MTLLAVLALGFFLGMRHATDSDHVLAVSTIVSRERTPRAALWVGALWGVGHSATIVTVGGAMVLFGWVIPPRLGLSMEMSVAIMLVVLGVINLSGALNRIERAAHHHRAPAVAATPGSVALKRRGGLRPVIIGVVHGLAGSAALALLVLATIESVSAGLLYLAIFGIGTVAGMMLLTLLMSLPISALARRFPESERIMARLAGVMSIAFGLFLAYQIGIGNGLVVGTPTWDPH
jgi:sulfite exporter TauE/SafE